MQLLVAIDGAILWLTMFSGWLNGVIARDRAHRFARGENLARLAVGGQVAGEDLAIVLHRLRGGELIDILRALGLVNRVLVADAQFQRQPFGQILALLADQLAGALQDLLRS